MSGKIMLVGEPMGLFIAQQEAPLDQVETFSSAVAGAEFNVAVGLSRLGHRVDYLTKLGRDPFGAKIEASMKKNGIDASLITWSSEKPTGFMLKGKTSHGDPQIFYFRKGSAASTIGPADVEKLDLTDYSLIHLTGITAALSSSTLEAIRLLMRRAREAGVPVSFDPNLRPQLWPDERTMADAINQLATNADYFLPGYKEGGVLIGTKDPQQIAKHYLQAGAKAVIVKTGPRGAYAATNEGGFSSPTFHAEKIVDTVGAGDGFAAGVLSGILEDLPLEECVRRGNAIGTIQVMSVGDNEGLPTREQLAQFMAVTPLDEVEE